LQGDNGRWPTDAWWVAYGDTQLSELIAEALAGAPDMAAAQARLSRASGYAEQAGARLQPKFDVNAYVVETKQSYNNGVPPQAVPHGWNEAASLSLDFRYEFDFFGRNKAALTAATSHVEAARADAVQARLVLSTAVASAYADLLGQMHELDLAAESVRIRTETARLVEKRRERGLETIASLGQARSALASARANESAQREAVELTRYRISALLGAGPDRGRALHRPQLLALHAAGVPDDLRSDLLGRRPDVLAARYRVEAAAASIEQARAAFYPSINLAGSIGTSVLGLGNFLKRDSLAGSFGPAISLPLFNQGALTGQYRGARADYDEAVANYDATVATALQQAASAITSSRAQGEQLAHARQAGLEADTAYRAASARYKGGLSNYIDVLSAENTLIAARRALSHAETRAFTLDVAMVRALGGGFRSQS
jgi:NodT family efflux transporter outer membrane factor (OMF) lipoprotein